MPKASSPTPAFDTYFEVDKHKIEWGTTLDEVLTILKDRGKKLRHQPVYEELQHKISGIFGFKASSVLMGAPFVNRPVLWIDYLIEPKKRYELDYYAEKLKALFQEPIETDEGDLDSNPYAPHYTMRWETANMIIRLYVYGGIRSDDDKHSATISLLRTDLIQLAKPYRAVTEKLEDDIAKYAQPVDIKKYQTRQKQRFLFKNYANNDVNIYFQEIEVPKEEAPELRLAQLALYKPHIFKTPSLISEALSKYEIGMYAIPELKQTIISNKLDSTIVSGNGETTIEYKRYKPSRGFKLNINGFGIENYDPLKELVADLEKITGQTIKDVESYVGH
jgi:hypothetical protein